ncbi:hypothetical protein [Paracoccus ravus]|uniref:hypothetical protein n=1 Tax=Paracoccus ravus TaxID=2447760 RepID=UPI001ADD04A1|nr:hypothetical protein [Paracoccus ravus]
MPYRLLAASLLAVSACSSDPADYATPTISVSTPSGPVTCQLYRHDMVLWDRALSRPATLSDDEANQVCRTEGYRIRHGAPEVTGSTGEMTVATEEPPL